MELKDFVSATLQQIIDGVAAAQQHAGKAGASVSPGQLTVTERPMLLWKRGGHEPVQLVEFDVAVSTSEAGEAKGGAGIFVGPVGIGAQSSSDTKSSAVNRIKFVVPLML